MKAHSSDGLYYKLSAYVKMTSDRTKVITILMFDFSFESSIKFVVFQEHVYFGSQKYLYEH